MSQDSYFDIPAVSNSLLKAWLRSPREAQMMLRGEGRTETAAMRQGSAAHMYALEREQFEATYFVAENRSKADKEANAEKEAQGMIRLTAAQMRDIEGQAEAIKAMEQAQHRAPWMAGLLGSKSVQREVTLTWTDEDTGLACKAKVDLLGGRVLADYKTCDDASPKGFLRKALKLDYLFQLAYYRLGAIANGYPIEACYLLAQETTAPYHCQHYVMPPDLLEEATERVRAAYRAYADFLAFNPVDGPDWPGREYHYQGRLEELGLLEPESDAVYLADWDTLKDLPL